MSVDTGVGGRERVIWLLEGGNGRNGKKCITIVDML